MSEMNPINIAVNTSAKTTFSGELRIIPGWAYALAGCGFLAMQFMFHFVVPRHHAYPREPALTVLGILAGCVLAVFLMLIGYVNADSRRRGMNPWLWTAIVLCIPNALGFIVYFLVRQPAMTSCPHCGTMLQPRFRFCPKCATPRSAVCGHCSAAVQPGDQFCNNCGRMLAEPMK